MSVEAITWAINYDAQNATEKAVLLVLANYASGDGECFPGQQSIAKQAACGERTVRRVLDSLQERGIIERRERRRRDGTRTSDTIVLVAFRQAANMAGSRSSTGQPVTTNRPTCPNQPATVAGPTTFEPSEDTSGEERARMRALPSQEDQDRFWSAYLPVGRVNFARSNLGIAMGRHVARLGSVERLIAAAKAYSAEIERHKSIPLSLAKWLADPNLVDQYAPTEAASSPDTRWTSLVRHFKRRGDWQGEGPAPGERGCLVPAHILAAEGYPAEPHLKIVGGK